MPRVPLSKEKIDLILKFDAEGKTNKQISEIINVPVSTVANNRARLKRGEPLKIELNKIKTQELADKVANMRLTMITRRVSEQLGFSASYINHLVKGHKLEKQFVKYRSSFPMKDVKKRKLKQKPATKKKDVVIIDQSNMQKGHVKLQKNETVLPNRIHKPKKSIPMYDSKNTVLFVDIDCQKSPEQIRAEWRTKQEQSLKNLAS